MSDMKYELTERCDLLCPSPALLKRTENMMAETLHKSDPQKRKLRKTAAGIALACAALLIVAGIMLEHPVVSQDRITQPVQGKPGIFANGSTLSEAEGSTLFEAPASDSSGQTGTNAVLSTMSETPQTSESTALADETGFTINGRALQPPFEIEQNGLIMTVHEMLSQDGGLHLSCSVRSEREEDVYVTLECKADLQEGCTREDMRISNYVSMILDGEMPCAPVLYRIEAGREAQIPYSVSCEKMNGFQGAYGLELTLRAYEADGAIEPAVPEEGILEYLSSERETAFIRGEGSAGSGTIANGAFNGMRIALKGAGLSTYRANLLALTESGLFRQVCVILQDVDILARRSDGSAQTLRGIDYDPAGSF